MKFQNITSSFFLAAAVFSGAAYAQASAPVVVEGSWARASLQGQKNSSAYMRLTAPVATRLVRVESSAAGVTEVHEMKMEGDVMKMRAMPGLDLPAGKTVELKPGSYHVMLLDLKAPLVKGANLPLTLVFQDAQGVEHPQLVQVPVAEAPAGAHGSKSSAHSH